MTALHDQSVRGRAADLRLSVSPGGAGTPLVLLHADLGNRGQWRATFDRLAPERPVASFDRAGHGQSSIPDDGRFDYRAEVADLAAVADAAGFERFILVGHSGGGAVAFLFAAEYPQRVARLLLVDPAQSGAAMPQEQKEAALEQTRHAPKQAAAAFYRMLAGPNPDVARRIVADVEATADQTIVGMVEALGRFTPEAVASPYRGPARAIIHGDADSPHQLHAIAGYPHEVIAGAGHWIHLAAPAAFDRALDAFVERAGQPVLSASPKEEPATSA
jgi:pimeloyl-ACP methyl ester carboxylesterase